VSAATLCFHRHSRFVLPAFAGVARTAVFAVRGSSQQAWKNRRPQNRRSALPDFLYSSFVFIYILALFPRFSCSADRWICGPRLVPATMEKPQTAEPAVCAAGPSQARRAEKLWPAAKAVGWPEFVTTQPASAGDRLPALRPMPLPPLRGLLMASSRGLRHGPHSAAAAPLRGLKEDA